MSTNNQTPEQSSKGLYRGKRKGDGTPENKPEGKMYRWIKASEKEPITQKSMPIKITEGKIKMYTTGHIIADGFFWDSINGTAWPPDQIEYLEEIPSVSDSKEEKPEEVDPFVKWLDREFINFNKGKISHYDTGAITALRAARKQYLSLKNPQP